MKKITFLLVLLLIFGCNKNENLHDEILAMDASMVTLESPKEEIAAISNEPVDSRAPIPPNQQTSPQKIDTISKKIIKNGNMGIVVDNIGSAKEKVNQILKNNKAYTQNETYRNTDDSENIELTIRVPNQNFDKLIGEFSNGVGFVEFKNISTDDVTEEYTDVAIKLENKRIYLEKYRNLLKAAANTKEMLEIQENIRALEDEIDVAEGRLRFIDDKVNYSTLQLSLHKEKAQTSITSKVGFGSRFIDSLAQGWNSFVSFILGLISFWPFFLLIPIVIFGWRKWRKRKK